MIHATSRSALAALRERLNGVLASLPDDGGASQQTLAGEIYEVADLFAGQPRLRRALADPSTDAAGRAEFMRSLLADRLSQAAVSLAADAVSQRWSEPWDLADALDVIGDDTLLAAAEQQRQLDTVEDELFRFERILAASGELAATLDERGVAAERRRGLLESLLAGKVNPITMRLLGHAVQSGRKRSLSLAVDDLLQASSLRRARSIARVVSAAELTPGQTARLSETLTRIYQRPIDVRTAVDPKVRGGLVIRVGDEVIDGSVATRLAAARAALAG